MVGGFIGDDDVLNMTDYICFYIDVRFYKN